jgi:hypothetical protein
MPTIIPAERAVFGIPAQSSTPSSTDTSVGSKTVLIPLVLSIALIALGIGLGVFCFVGYRRRQRIWWRDFERRRGLRLREKEDEVEEKPGMWEVEVRDEGLCGNVENDHDWKETVCPSSPKRLISSLWL